MIAYGPCERCTVVRPLFTCFECGQELCGDHYPTPEDLCRVCTAEKESLCLIAA